MINNVKDKIILLNPPSNLRYIHDYYCTFSPKTDYYWPPQDLIALSGILSKRYDVEVMDAIGCSISEGDCFEKITQSSARIIFFTTGRSTLEADMAFLERVKKNKPVRIIASGSIFRFEGEALLKKYPFLDAYLENFTDEEEVAAVMRGERLACSETGKKEDFSIGLPLQEVFLKSDNHIPLFGDSAFATVISSMGCSFQCKFCVAGTIRIKRRVLSEVVEELKYVASLGVKNVFFADPLFTADKKRTLELCAMMNALGLKLNWICNAHVSTLLDESFLQAMRACGCQGLMVGVESASDEILRRYAKGITTVQVREAFRLCRKTGIKTLAYFILGLPGEDARSLKKTIAFAKEIKCDYASFGYATADIGTELRKESLQRGWVISSAGEESSDSSSTPALETSEISGEELRKIKRQAYLKFYCRPQFILQKFQEAKTWPDKKILIKQGWELLTKNIFS